MTYKIEYVLYNILILCEKNVLKEIRSLKDVIEFEAMDIFYLGKMIQWLSLL